MQIQIDLNSWQRERLEKITKAYMERGLFYTLDEMLAIILRTHLGEYIDQELDSQEERLFTSVKGRVKGRWEEAKS